MDFVLLPGQRHDLFGVAPLLDGVEFEALIANKGVVVMETLGLLDMMKDKRGAGALSDAALRSFQDKIIYRCEAKRIEVIKVDRWFPSTQLCSGCGKLQKMSLDKRVYKCACGLELGRDFNAALNLERYGKERT